MLHIYTKGTAKITCNGKSEMIEETNNKNLNSRVQHPVARISIGFTNVYYHRTQLKSLSLSLF
jgi:hypothetical protein